VQRPQNRVASAKGTSTRPGGRGKDPDEDMDLPPCPLNSYLKNPERQSSTFCFLLPRLPLGVLALSCQVSCTAALSVQFSA